MNNEFEDKCEFAESISALTKVVEQKSMEAKQIVTEYYDWWKAQNLDAINLRALGEDINTGVIGPFHKVHPTNGKVYISWAEWPRTSAVQRKKMDKTFAKHIAPWKVGYCEKQLAAYCQGWELENVVNTEKKLAPLREAINLCHQSIKDIQRHKRKFSNRGN